MKRHILILVVMATFQADSIAAQEPRIADCPVVMVSCPDSTDSQSVFFTASVGNVRNAKYVWTVSSGIITQGQGTKAIRVRLGSERSITATIEVIGLPASCGNKASCSILGEEWLPKARKFDEYRLDCRAKVRQRSKPKGSRRGTIPK